MSVFPSTFQQANLSNESENDLLQWTKPHDLENRVVESLWHWFEEKQFSKEQLHTAFNVREIIPDKVQIIGLCQTTQSRESIAHFRKLGSPAFVPQIAMAAFSLSAVNPEPEAVQTGLTPLNIKKQRRIWGETGLVILLDALQKVSQNAPGKVKEDSKYNTPAN